MTLADDELITAPGQVRSHAGARHHGGFDRRARKKAQTRLQIRRAAQRLFAARGFDAVPITDIATKADVAVQTVFNHFSTKEALFFDGRTDWVDGPATAVRSRCPGTPPLSALREHLVMWVTETVRFEATSEGRAYVSAVAASHALSVHERELVHAAESRLREALAEAWADRVPDPVAAASVVAATWLAACRTFVVTQRSVPDMNETAVADVAEQVDLVLRALDVSGLSAG